MFIPYNISASDDDAVIFMFSPALVSAESVSSDCVKSICSPSNEVEPDVEVTICNLSVGVDVPIPTQSDETARYAVAVPSVQTPPPPPTSSVSQVSIPAIVERAVKVVNDPS